METDIIGRREERTEDSVQSIRERLVSSKNDKASQAELISYFKQLYKRKDDDLNLDQRLLLNDVLCVWFLRAIQWGQGSDIYEKVSEDELLEVWEYIISFLEHNSNAVVNSLSHLSMKLLQFCKHRVGMDPIVEKLILRVTKMNYRSKFFYLLIEKIAKEGFPNQIMETFPQFPEICIEMIYPGSIGHSISKSFVAVISEPYKGIDPEIQVDRWFSVVKKGLQSDERKEKVLEHLLPALLKCDNNMFGAFIARLDLDLSDNENLNYLINLLTKGLEMMVLNSPFDYVSRETLKKFSIHENPNYRLSSFRLFTQMFLGKKTELEDFLSSSQILTTMNSFVNDFEDLHTRNEFSSLFNKVVIKLKELRYKLSKDLQKLKIKNVNHSKQLLFENDIILIENFVEQTYTRLQFTLQSSCSYAQLYTSYKLLDTLVDSSLLFEIESVSLNPTSSPIVCLVDILLSNIANSYDDIREKSMDLLLNFPSEILNPAIHSREKLLIGSSFDYLLDLKGKNSERGAKMIHFFINFYIRKKPMSDEVSNLFTNLVDKLKKYNPKSSHSFSNRQNRVHGYYIALVYGFDDVSSFLSKNNNEVLISNSSQLLKSIFETWDFFQSILKDPHEISKGTGDDVIVKTYMWKLLKSSNDLMVKMLVASSYIEIFDDQIILKAADLVIYQLSHVDHKSTFSSIYGSFVSITKYCLNTQSLRSEPRRWLESNIETIKTKVQKITRRSAGLPYLITGILSSTKPDSSEVDELMSFTINELISIADISADNVMNHEHDLPQVHAFNCIRQILLDSDINGRCRPYMVRLLRLSLKNFGSDVWAIRNCSMMLFTAIQNNLFGTIMYKSVRSKVSWRLLTSRYQGLDSEISNCLEKALTENQNELLFPVLTILSQFEVYKGDSNLTAIRESIINLMDHRFWKVREMVARSLSCIVPLEEMNEFIRYLSRECQYSKSRNKTHTILLSISEILKLAHHSAVDIDSNILSEIEKVMLGFFTELKSFSWSSGKVAIDILDNLKQLNYCISPSILNYIGNCNLNLILRGTSELDGPCDLFISSTTKFILTILKDTDARDELSNLIQICLLSKNYSLHCITLDFCTTNIESLVGLDEEEIFGELWKLAFNEQTFIEIRMKCFRIISFFLTHLQRHFRVLSGDNFHTSVESLQSLIFKKHSSVNLKFVVLECYGCVVSRMSSLAVHEFISLCEESYSDETPSEVRRSIVVSVINYLSNEAVKNEHFCRCVFFLFDVLFDNDKGIRHRCTEFLSQLCAIGFTCHYTYLAENWYSLISNLIRRDIVNKSTIGLFLSYEINEMILVAKQNHKNDSLLDIESVNLFKNEVERISYVLNMLRSVFTHEGITSSDLDSLARKLVEDFKKIQNLTSLYDNDMIADWSLDKSNFIPTLITILNIKTIESLMPSNEAIASSLGELEPICSKTHNHSLLDLYLYRH